MLALAPQNSQVYTAIEPVVTLGQEEERFLKAALKREAVDRVRICCHHTTDDCLHEMLILFSGATYIRPALHIDKEESLLILEGLGTYYFFDEHGRITQQVPMGPMGSGRSFYCRIPANTYHALLVESDFMLGKETTSGPFNRCDTVFAAWSPDGTDRRQVREYLECLRSAKK